jgi:hypothetical protein
MRSQQTLDPGRQLTQPSADGVIDRIGHRRGGADIGELAKALHAGRVDMAVLLRNEDDLDVGDIGFTGIR